MTDLVNERRHFLRRLKTSPVFLAAHFNDLSSAVFRKLKNRVRTRLLGQQHGAKETPLWLADSFSPKHGTVRAAQAACLPAYPWPVPNGVAAAVDASSQHDATDDPERYFSRNRWGFLLDTLLEGNAVCNDDLRSVREWIAQHGDKQDRAWEIYSACERVANLLVYLAASSATPEPIRNDPILGGFIEDSVMWIADHLEYYGPGNTNNHIINNARALLVGGVAVADEAAVAKGMRIFRECLPQMVMTHGFLRERSSHYQLVVLNWLLDAAHFCAAFRGESSDDAQFLRNFAVRMAAAAGLVCDDMGQLAVLIGDISPDTSPVKSAARLSRLYPLYWPVASGPGAPVIQDGWFRFSAGLDRVIGNFPPGDFPPPFPTHGHADYTSFAWHHDGFEILADTGRCLYIDEPISRFQQSAVGHNVPLVNGFASVSDSLIANGRWWPRPYAAARLEISPAGAGVLLRHNGFARATPVEWHARRIVPQSDGIMVVDSFGGQGSVEVSLCWNFGEGLATFDGATLTARGSAGEVQLAIGGAGGAPEVTCLSGSGPGSWRSRNYGEVCPALGVGLGWHINLPAEISTKFAYTRCVE